MDETVIAAKPRKRAPRKPRKPVAPPGPAGFAPLVTERLKLRPPIPEDAESLHRLINDWEVTRMLARVPFPYQREEADKWIASAARELEQGSAYHLAITGRTTSRRSWSAASACTSTPRHALGRLGYWVGRALLGSRRRDRGRRADDQLGFANLTWTASRGGGDGQRRLARRAAPHRLPPNRRRATSTSLARTPTAGLDVRGDPRRHLRPHRGAGRGAPGAKPLLLVAACALVDVDGRVLLARRPEGKKMAGLWEFPGGKLQPGETPEAALIRELKEELGIDVAAGCLAPFAFASHDYEGFHLLMPLYLCRRWKGMPSRGRGRRWPGCSAAEADRIPDAAGGQAAGAAVARLPVEERPCRRKIPPPACW